LSGTSKPGGYGPQIGGLQKEMHHFAEWLGDHLRFELQREAWEAPELVMDEDGVSLYLYSPSWKLPDEDHVAFSFASPNLLYDLPCVQLYLPAEEVFEQRNKLLDRLRPSLKQSGFTDYYERGDPDPSCPLWKYIRLEEFHGESGFDLDSFVAAIVDGFRELRRTAASRQSHSSIRNVRDWGLSAG
jgi:hypothetical protein